MTLAALLGLVTPLIGAAESAELALIAQETRIPWGQTRVFDFTTVPQKDTTVLLDVVSRLDSDAFGGSMYFMKIVLNGRLVTAAKSRIVSRLVNRPIVSPVAPNLPYSWFGSEAWRVLYAPNFQGALQRTFYVGNPYQLVLDVTDLTNPMSENRLEITNTASSVHVGITKRKAELVIRSLQIRTKPVPSAMMSAENARDRDVINRGTPGAGPAPYKGRVTPGGGFAIDVEGQRFQFASSFSYPNAGLNRLVAAGKPDTACQKGWSLRVVPAPDGGQVIGHGPDYHIERQVRFIPRRVDVADRITNLHEDRKLGLLVRHDVVLKGKQARVRIAGNPDPAVNGYYANANPSVYVAVKDVGLGMICQDDIFRNQAWLFYDKETESAGLRDEVLCLPEGGSVTLRWSVYPVASADYYDFVNLVRQDWGSNYTVDGAWCFFNPDTILATSPAFIHDNFRRLGIKYACYCGGWVDRKHDKKKIGFGTGVMDPYWADFRSRLRAAAAKIRAAVPECKVLVYYDTQRDTSDGGHERFRDSWLTDRNGNQLSTNWSGVYSLTQSVVATLENSYGRAMLAAVDRYFDEIGVDGLYWDEMETTGYGTPLVTYNTPDGYSCLLDEKTYTIQREIGITSILGKGHRAAVIDRVRARGGVVMGNGPTTNRELLSRHVPRMVEIQHNAFWCYQGNLDSPLGYASSRTDFGNWIRALDMATLLVGTRYTYEHEISRYVFPFTPIELHAGYLLGEERIITTHSGAFGWPGQKCLVRVHHFDKDGKRTGKDFPTTIEHEARTQVDVLSGEAVILQRLPIVVEPTSGHARASRVRFDESGCSLTVQARAGTRLRMAADAKQSFTVRVGDAARSLTADAKGTLDLRLPSSPTPVTVHILQ